MWTRRDDAMFDRMVGDEYEGRIAAARRRNAEIDRAEDERAAKAKAEAERRTRRNNAVMQLREYQRAGVKPPSVDENGYPTISLTLLLDIGWAIDDDNGDKVLVKPSRVASW